MPTLFELRDVWFNYEGIAALQGLSLEIAQGERLALVGANGSGKSTLLRLLDGLCFPSRGAVSFDGQPLTPSRLNDDSFSLAFRRRVALVFQNPDVQLFNPTVFDEVAFAPLQMGWPKEQLIERVTQTMEWMSLTQLRERPPYRLSGGEKNAWRWRRSSCSIRMSCFWTSRPRRSTRAVKARSSISFSSGKGRRRP